MSTMCPFGPEVTVVMPNYNKARYVSSAVESVLNQTFKNLELVIVDDASTDDSIAVATKYTGSPDGNVRLLRLNERKGPAAARNTGIRNARGKIICFIDSDDVYSPLKVERQLQELRRESKPVVVYCDWWRIDENGNTLNPGKRERLRKGGRVFPEFLMKVFGFSTMFMLRKEMLESVGLYDESLWWAEDYDLALKLARDYDFRYVSEPLYGYRTHRGNTRNQRGRKERLFLEGLVTERYLRLGKALLDSDTERSVITLMMRYFALTGQRRKMIRYGFLSPAAFKRMAASFLNYREIG